MKENKLEEKRKKIYNPNLLNKIYDLLEIMKFILTNDKIITISQVQYITLIQNYGEKKAELYYKDHYQGGLSNDDEDNGFEESSSSDDSSNKENEYEFSNNNGEIFNKIVKEKLDNVTVMTTINTTGSISERKFLIITKNTLLCRKA